MFSFLSVSVSITFMLESLRKHENKMRVTQIPFILPLRGGQGEGRGDGAEEQDPAK